MNSQSLGYAHAQCYQQNLEGSGGRCSQKFVIVFRNVEKSDPAKFLRSIDASAKEGSEHTYRAAEKQ